MGLLVCLMITNIFGLSMEEVRKTWTAYDVCKLMVRESSPTNWYIEVP